MSTQYQTYSLNNQTYVQQNVGYGRAQQNVGPYRRTQQNVGYGLAQQNVGYGHPMPQMVPMGSPMFQPMQVTAAGPQVYIPSLSHLNSGFQGMTLAASAPMQQSTPPYIPFNLSGSLESNDLALAPNMGLPLVQVGSLESSPSLQRSPSPVMGMVPSYSPQPYPIYHPPMISLIAHSSSPLPSTAVSAPPQQTRVRHCSTGSVTVTDYSHDSPLPINANFTMLGFGEVSVPRSISPSCSIHSVRSHTRSSSGYSVGSEADRERSVERSEPPSKRQLVNRAFAKFQAMFGENFDQNGNRGENILRLKVKTRTALEQIVPLVEFCQQENLIVSVSCPISTKKGRQQVRGFLAYLQMKNERDADRVEQLIQEYNANHESPFSAWHRNPPSTWKKKPTQV